MLRSVFRFRRSCDRLHSGVTSCRLLNNSALHNPPEGFRDFYPEQLQQRQWMHDNWKNTARTFGFEEISSPIVEYLDMYDRHPNETINNASYTFRDNGKKHVLLLKPDMTPSLVRMVVENHPKATYPLKWFSIPQVFSHSTQSINREHYQWNMDVWGVGGVEAEAELLSAAVSSLKDMGLTSEDVVFKINSRKITNGLMSLQGISEDKWVTAHILIDKSHRQTVRELLPELRSAGVTEDQFSRLLVSLKEASIVDLSAAFSSSGTAIGTEGVADLLRLQELLDHYGLQEWTQFDASVVRGLAYYTGVVFEAFDRAGALRAICGGGRYDHMLKPMFDVNGEFYPTAAAGLKIDDIPLQELLRRRGLLPSEDVSSSACSDVQLRIPREAEAQGYGLAQFMRSVGLSVDADCAVDGEVAAADGRARLEVRIGTVITSGTGGGEESFEVTVRSTATDTEEVVAVDSRRNDSKLELAQSVKRLIDLSQ